MATVQQTESHTPVTLGRLLTTSAAIFLGAAGVVHLGAAGEHLDHALVAGAFVAMGAVQLVVAGSIVASASRVRLATGAAVSVAVVGVWIITRVTAISWISGLESAQPIGAEDLIATGLELAVVGAVALALVIPSSALAAVVTGGQRPLAAAAAAALVLMSVGVIVPHDHGHGAPGHGHNALASAAAAAHDDSDGHGHGTATASARRTASHAADGHPHAPMTFEEAEAALTGHAHKPGTASLHQHRSSDDAAPTPGHRHAANAEHAHDAANHPTHSPAAHQHGAAAPRQEQVILQGSSGQFEGQRLSYEPATPDGKHGAAIRHHNPKDEKAHAEMHSVNKPCTPTSQQRAFAARLLRDSKKAIAVYDNNPGRALADGFIAYPIPLSKMFHMVNIGRARGDKYELTPSKVESFMYAMTDSGLKAVGAMYMFAPKDRTPPNPTGCILQWHRHTGTQGAVTSFDPNEPFASIWMGHVWTFGYDDPWRDGDGTEAHTWFMGYRYLPNICNSVGECI